tara:strand:- start:88 stop:591 length:504 start_codon:yes stop_codon:yes gene_type:complete
MKDKIIENYADLGTTGANYNIAMEISNKIQELFFEDKFDVCTIVYNKFVSVLNQEVTRQQIIPLQINVLKKEQNSSTDEKNDNSIYNYEPDEAAILKDLLPKNISIQIFKVLLESNAGEQGARMAAMDNATRNAGEMIDNLTLKYNRTRQAFITKELIEIISGAESV